MVTSIDTAELLRLRMSSQRITPPADAKPDVPTVVRQLLAAQAQDFGQALWALGLRAPGSTKDDVTRALEHREVVRSWPMRGTLHFVAPDDLRWILGLTTARMIAGALTRQRQLDLDQGILDRARSIATAELAGGGALGRTEFTTVLENAGIETTGQRGYHIIWYLAQLGVLCWGPPRGRGQALVLFDEWAPQRHELSRQEALRQFALRYFTGHGPATIRDFAWWSKLTLTDARAGLAAAREELTELDHAGMSFWMATAERTAAGASAPATVHALPGFDEYLLGYRDRSHALPAEHANRIVPGGNGIFLPVILGRGRVVGTWRRTVDAKGATVTSDPFAALSKRDVAGFARAATAYACFSGVPLSTPVA